MCVVPALSGHGGDISSSVEHATFPGIFMRLLTIKEIGVFCVGMPV